MSIDCRSFIFGLLGGLSYYSGMPKLWFLGNKKLKLLQEKEIGQLPKNLNLTMARLGFLTHWFLLIYSHFHFCSFLENYGVPTSYVFCYFWFMVIIGLSILSSFILLVGKKVWIKN